MKLHRQAHAGLLFVAAFTLAACVEPTLTRYDLAPERPDATAIRVLQLSDFHHPWHPDLERLRALVRQAEPDLVVFTGDLANSEAERPEAMLALLAITEGRPLLAIRGNWDADQNEMSRLALASFYEACGIPYLENRALDLLIKGRRIQVYGWDDSLEGHPRPPAPPAEGTELVLHLVHEPQAVKAFPPASPPGSAALPYLALAGHTHGGQITLFGQALVLPKGSDAYRGGLYPIPGGRLIVSRGLGNSHLPFRIGVDPELVLVRL